MHTSVVRFVRAHYSLLFIFALTSLLVTSVALADIVSGSSTTNKSNDVTITELTLSVPSVSAGDFLLANVTVNGGSSAVITAPSRWTQILRTDNDSSVSVISYWKTASASDAAGSNTYTWQVEHQTTAE